MGREVGSRETEIGILPVDWEVQRLQDVVDPKRRITYGIVQPGGDVEGGVPLIRGGDYSAGEVVREGLYHVAPAIAEAYARATVRAGDILVAIVGYVGQSALVPPELDGANITQTTARIAIPQPHSNRFFLHYTKSYGFLREVHRYTKGSAQPGLNLSDVQRFVVPVPPPKEQRKIAAILSSVDDAIAATRKVIEQTKRVKQGLLQTLMTRGIGHTRFKKTNIGEIPSDWGITSLGEACAHVTKGATPTTYGHDWVNGGADGVLFLRSECVSEEGFQLNGSERISEAAHASMGRSEIRAGDVLVTITGNVGRVGQVPEGVERANINQHLARVRVIDPVLLQDFVHHALQVKRQRDRFETIVTGLAYPQLSLRQVRDTQVPVPPLGEQEIIVNRIRAVHVVLGRHTASLEAWDKMKRGLMQDLLTGRVRVRPD